jgi:ribosomal protein S18 acetylase RimI-like enzyme
MIIRKANINDLKVLVDFQQRLAQESEGLHLDEAKLTAGMKSLLEDSAKGIYYLVEDNNEPVACHLITYEWSDWRNGTVWWLQSVYVIETYRGKGVFRKMYDNVIKMIQKDDGLIGLRLYVDKSNERAMKVYASMGMNGDHYTVYEWMK